MGEGLEDEDESSGPDFWNEITEKIKCVCF
jgi:hypothetical protein